MILLLFSTVVLPSKLNLVGCRMLSDDKVISFKVGLGSAGGSSLLYGIHCNNKKISVLQKPIECQGKLHLGLVSGA